MPKALEKKLGIRFGIALTGYGMCKGAMIKPNAHPATLATRQAITKS
jgi:hypothetical protein